MKKRFCNKLMALAVAFALVGTMLTTPISAYAAETDVTAEIEEDAPGVEARSVTSYYPSSGVTSGNFYGATSSAATFTNLPGSTTLKLSYAIDGGSCRFRFYIGTSTVGTYTKQTALLSGDGVIDVVLPVSGTYTVELYYPNGSSNTLVIYGYRLYKQ